MIKNQPVTRELNWRYPKTKNTPKTFLHWTIFLYFQFYENVDDAIYLLIMSVLPVYKIDLNPSSYF